MFIPVQLLDVLVPPALLPIHLLIHHVQGHTCQLTQLVCGQQLSYSLYAQTDACTDRHIPRQASAYRCMQRQMHAKTDACTDRCMHRQTYAKTDICHNKCMHRRMLCCKMCTISSDRQVNFALPNTEPYLPPAAEL